MSLRHCLLNFPLHPFLLAGVHLGPRPTANRLFILSMTILRFYAGKIWLSQILAETTKFWQTLDNIDYAR
jgi:hypothetical protein